MDGVAGKRKRFRGGVGVLEYLGKTFGPEVKLLPGTTAAKTAENQAHYAGWSTGYFSPSLSPMSEAEPVSYTHLTLPTILLV